MYSFVCCLAVAKLLSLLICATFVVGVSVGHLLFLNIVVVFIWQTYLVIMISVPPPSHSGASVFCLRNYSVCLPVC